MQPKPRTSRTVRRLYLAAMSLLLAALLVLAILPPLWTYREARARIEKELEDRLLSVGQAIVPAVLPLWADSADASRSAARGSTTREDLIRIASGSGLGSIQVIDAQRRRVISTVEPGGIGEVDPLLAAQTEVAVALAGIPLATPLYEAPGVPGTYFKTGFVPVEDSSGRIHGVIAVSGGTAFFEILPVLRRTWLWSGLISGTVALVLALLLYFIFRALERYERGMRSAAALATAGQLAAVVAHEVRNPLAALQSRAERVQEEIRAGTRREDLIHLLDAIPLEVRRLSRILTNYLSLARMREGSGVCPIRPVVEETLELVEQDLARSSIRAQVSCPDQDLRARIDAGPLRQALLNLLLNAREAMPDGGTATIRAGAEGGWVRIEVEDTGRGMDERTRKRIFEPFFTTRASGSGLGLAVVDSVVRSVGGRVAIRSRIGEGTTFTIWLPKE